ncbi:DUF551 domain-containing protein [Klebsiella pneumoniae]|uniref:DUF551 domain-containing protein n=1 Tax=Klebsiella pneumoniae TaxID=573 RepID=UPI002B3FFC85|nr:DUF551 domain-containing protein [Klebsiella pneumoniae]
MPPAQPAPVVDADDNFYSWFGREWAENYQHNQYTTAAKQMLGVMAESAWKAGRRAAMLAAAPQPHNAPQNIPEIIPGWIPVSERIPIPGVDVLVAKEFFGPGDWRRKVGHVRHEESGWNIYGASWEPTHWVPLPASPQEVK